MSASADNLTSQAIITLNPRSAIAVIETQTGYTVPVDAGYSMKDDGQMGRIKPTPLSGN